MENRKRITGYVTPGLSDCYNEHAKQVVENCVERYKVIPHGVHQEKGIKTLCKELDRLLKEVYRYYSRLDRIVGKNPPCVIDVSDRVTYATNYPTCESISSSVDFTWYCVTNYLEIERHMISSWFNTNSNDLKASELACCIVTDLRKISALLLWLHKYGVANDRYVSKDSQMCVSVIYPYLIDNDDNVVLSNTCDFTITRMFDGRTRRINYSKKGKMWCNW